MNTEKYHNIRENFDWLGGDVSHVATANAESNDTNINDISHDAIDNGLYDNADNSDVGYVASLFTETSEGDNRV